METTTPVRTGIRRLLREADQVLVYAAGLGYVSVTKKTASRLLKSKAGRVTVEPVAELGLLLLNPSTS